MTSITIQREVLEQFLTRLTSSLYSSDFTEPLGQYKTELYYREAVDLLAALTAPIPVDASVEREARPVYYRYRSIYHKGDWNVVVPADLPKDKSALEVEPLYNKLALPSPGDKALVGGERSPAVQKALDYFNRRAADLDAEKLANKCDYWGGAGETESQRCLLEAAKMLRGPSPIASPVVEGDHRDFEVTSALVDQSSQSLGEASLLSEVEDILNECQDDFVRCEVCGFSDNDATSESNLYLMLRATVAKYAATPPTPHYAACAYDGEITISARLLHALWCYGNLHAVTGVVYPPGSHQECLAQVDAIFFKRAQAIERARTAARSREG